MKKTTRFTAMLLALIAAFTICSTAAFADNGLSRANDIFNPGGASYQERKQQELQARLDDLSYDAWCTYEYMAIPNLRDMLETPQSRYANDRYTGRGIKYYDAPNGITLGRIRSGSKATVYAHYGNWAFAQFSDGTACWVAGSDVTR